MATPTEGKRYSGPVARLALWFQHYCEQWDFMRPGETIPTGIQIDPKLLMPLLSYNPVEFEEQLYHECEVGLDEGKVICTNCKLPIVDHYENLMKLQLAKIEILESEMKAMQDVCDELPGMDYQQIMADADQLAQDELQGEIQQAREGFATTSDEAARIVDAEQDS